MARPRKLKITTPESPGPALDSTTRGTVDVWPIIRAEPAQLAKEIEAGDHDGMLSELQAVEVARRKSPLVLQAFEARSAKLGD